LVKSKIRRTGENLAAAAAAYGETAKTWQRRQNGSKQHGENQRINGETKAKWRQPAWHQHHGSVESWRRNQHGRMAKKRQRAK